MDNKNTAIYGWIMFNIDNIDSKKSSNLWFNHV